MNHLRRALRGTAHLVTRLCDLVERVDARADAALRAWGRPLAARLAGLLHRMAAANCSDALTRNLPCRTRERERERAALEAAPHPTDRTAHENAPRNAAGPGGRHGERPPGPATG
ncbi:hypothetical protein [Kitasatospora sp. NPDC093806]|uniref:hypothetical protein n=1 Tax=Kitasatospora sp. NPDC093806 TaxID=3155075 RepID=UPI0034346C52